MAGPTNNTPQTRNVASRIYVPKPEHHKLKMLVYGDPGTGKTTLAATAGDHPDMKEVLFINIEGGMMSVVGAESVGIKNVPSVVDLKNYSELEGIFWFLVNEKHPFKTLVIDSLSELAKVNLDSIMKTQMEKGGSGKQRTDMDDIFLEDYGKNTQQMRRVVRAFRDLPMHVILTCHATTSMDKEKNETVFPALTPKLLQSVMGFMDVVGYLFVKAKEVEEGQRKVEVIERKLLTKPVGKWMVKDRSPGGRLGTIMTNPTMPAIIEKIRGGK